MRFRGPFLYGSKNETFLSDDLKLIFDVHAPDPNVWAFAPFLSNHRSTFVLCAFQEAFLLKARTDDDSDCTRPRMWETSSEIRKRQRLRTPSPIECAGRCPSRAIFFTVTGLSLRKVAASSGVTNGSWSSAGFMMLLHLKAVLTLRQHRVRVRAS